MFRLGFLTAIVVCVTPAARADDKLSLEARVVGLDGKPVATSSILLWRLVPEAERPQKLADPKVARFLWHEAGSRAVWENVGGAATNDKLRRDDLAPGTYRVTARQGHHQATPIGVSEPVVLDRSREVIVQLRLGPTLTIRPVDAANGQSLKDVEIGLSREGADLPPAWGFFGKQEGDRVTIDNFPPGTYRLTASRRTWRPEELEYAAGAEQRVVVVAGVDQDLVLDPFCGSGQSLLAAKGCGRRFLGIEREDKYVKIALGRLR